MIKFVDKFFKTLGCYKMAFTNFYVKKSLAKSNFENIKNFLLAIEIVFDTFEIDENALKFDDYDDFDKFLNEIVFIIGNKNFVKKSFGTFYVGSKINGENDNYIVVVAEKIKNLILLGYIFKIGGTLDLKKCHKLWDININYDKIRGLNEVY